MGQYKQNHLKSQQKLISQQKHAIRTVNAWRYNVTRNVNPDFSIVTMRRVAIIFFEWGIVKKCMQKF